MCAYGVPITLNLPVEGQIAWGGPLNEILQEIIDVIGQRVTVDGLDIAASLDMNGNALVDARNIQFITNGDPGTINSIFYSTDGELFIRDGANRLVQITSGGAVNIGGTGGFGGDYVSTNQNGAVYTNATQTFQFTAAGGTVFAPIEAGRLVVHEGGSDAVTLRAPSDLTSYTLRFPNNVPAGARAIVTADATGSLAFSLSASFEDWIPVQQGRITDADPESVYVGGIWNLGPGGTNRMDIGIPYRTGDRIDSISYGTEGVEVTATLFHVNNGGARTQVLRKSSSGAGPRLDVLQAGSNNMTGTLPYTPPGTGSLFLQLANSAAGGYVNINTVKVVGMRKIIS